MFHKPKKKTKIMESHTLTYIYNSRNLSEIKENLDQDVEAYIQYVPRKTGPLVNSN